jgi:S-DNA-T family DNA segregation ATPase FtsK/SpoIIIE
VSSSPTITEVKQRQYGILGLILLGVGLLALFETLFSTADTHVLRLIAGKGAIPLALAFVLLGLYFTFYRFLAPRLGPHWYPEALLGVELTFLVGFVALHLREGGSYIDLYRGEGGGIIGWSIGELMVAGLGRPAAWIVLASLALIGLFLIWEYTPLRTLDVRNLPLPSVSLPRAKRSFEPDADDSDWDEPVHPVAKVESAKAPAKEPAKPARKRKRMIRRRQAGGGKRATQTRRSKKLPPSSLLQAEDSGGGTDEQAEIQARIIEDTLMSLGVPAEVVEINVGPTVTQFGVRPGVYERGGQMRRVSVSQITALADDLALALAASPIRIEAPVPGKSYVGVEAPNRDATLVSLGRLLQDRAFRKIRSPLAVPFGRDVSGRAIAADLRRLPHLLVAGATGSGKSVALNAIICSFLFNNLPSALQLILVDPKRVEFPGYNGAPHLLSPVVVDAKHAEGALSWLLIEMDERYRMFGRAAVRNLSGYNKLASPSERLPYIVMVVDELADLMVSAPEAIETKLVRLAQMSRATGIHLIIATQRPSVDVVTGLIKANFPARLAFAVTSQVDSRVILDSPGAEKLLGRGDGLLMLPDVPQPTRIQGCFVSDTEINGLVSWWREHGPETDADPGKPLYPWSSLLVEEATTDDLLQNAIDSLRGRQTITTSGLQRLMGVGYPRAARLIDELDRGRDDFCRRHFHHDSTDPLEYDLIVNSARLSSDAAAELIVDAFCRARRGRAAKDDAVRGTRRQ